MFPLGRVWTEAEFAREREKELLILNGLMIHAAGAQLMKTKKSGKNPLDDLIKKLRKG